MEYEDKNFFKIAKCSGGEKGKLMYNYRTRGAWGEVDTVQMFVGDR